jgi:hypothetical protein
MDGTAQNYLAGNTGIGQLPSATDTLAVTGTTLLTGNTAVVGTFSTTSTALGGHLFAAAAADGVHNYILNSALVRFDHATGSALNMYRAGVLKSQVYDNGSAFVVGAYANESLLLISNNITIATVSTTGVAITGTVNSSGGAWFGTAALATGATTGHVYIQTSAGAPTGVPAAKTGQVALQFDTTNNKLYVYDGAWLSTAVLT